MSRLAPLLALAAVPLVVRAAPPVEGRIETDEGRVEILGTPVRVGERVDLPEGWFRVEEAGPEDGEVGSFSVVPVERLSTAGAAVASAPAEDAAPAPADGAGPAPARPAAAPACSAERSAYLAELWRASGVEVSSPGALLEALGSGAGPAAGFYWFALATDPFRPLAWDSALRDRAEALVRCARTN